MLVQIGKKYKDAFGNKWQVICKNPGEDYKHPVYYRDPEAPYEGVGSPAEYPFIIVDCERGFYDSCRLDGSYGAVEHDLSRVLIEDISKKFIMHKKSKNVYCVDENDDFCLYDDEDETRFTLGKPPKIDWSFYVKLDIAFEEYLELTGLKRKPKTLEIRKKLEESFGCQKELMTPILNKLEELIEEISKQKSCDGAISNFEKYVWSALHLLFQDKYKPSTNADFDESYRILKEYFKAKELENLQKTPQKVA